MPSEQLPPRPLIDFCKLVEADQGLQARVRQAGSAAEIQAIAQALGCPLSALQWRTWSRELSAPWFPWAGKSNEWRRRFFDECVDDH